MNSKQIPPWGKVALKHYGVKEFHGLDKNNPVIVEFIKLATKGKTLPDETSWCSAFAVACILGAGIKPVYGLVAKSWKGFGRKLEKPVDWCIVVIDSPNPKAETWQGHVTFYLSPKTAYELMVALGVKGKIYNPNKYFIGFGGNQNNQVGFNLYPLSLIEACVWPIEYLNFNDMTLTIRKKVINYVDAKMDTIPSGSVTPNQVFLDIDKNKITLKLQKLGYTILGLLKGVGWLAAGVLQFIPSAATKATGKGIVLLLDQGQAKSVSKITELIEKFIEFIKLLIYKIKGDKTK